MFINIYHTNDIHSEYDFLRKVDKFLKDYRNEEDFYFDIGDYNDIKSILVDSDKGNMAMELFMETGIDLMAIGNNEIDLEYNAIKNIVNKFPVICSNLTDANDNEIAGLKKSLILEKSNKKFLIISVAPYYGVNFEHGKYNKFFILGNLKTTDPIVAIKNEIQKHHGGYDFCILLSHSGHIIDQKIIDEIPQIDLVLGAHTHIVVKSEKYSMCGKGEYLGRVKLEILENEILISEISHIDLCEVKNQKFDLILNEKMKIASEILSKEIPCISELKFDPFRENELINFICDALYKEISCDFAMMHNGIAEGSLYKPVSRKSLLENFPSKLNPTMFTVKGKFIVEAVKKSFDEKFITQDGKGAGFRGSVLGALGFSKNVEINKEPFSMKIDGKEIDKNRVYKVGSDDYLQRGTGYTSLKTPDKSAVFENMFIRDLVEKYLEDYEIFKSSKINRIK